MRRLADDFLGRRQTDRRAHRPRQPRPRIGRRRPNTLGQSTQHHHVRSLQPRLQQAPDEHARMLGPAAPTQCPTAAHDLALQHRIEQSWQHVAPLVRQLRQRGLHVGEPGRQRLAFLAGPKARRPGQFVGGGKALGRLDQCRQGQGRRHLDCGIDPQRRLQAGFQPRQQCYCVGLHAGPVERAAQPDQATPWPRPPQTGELHRARRSSAGGRRQSSGGQRVFQQREQRDRRQPVGHRAGQQAEEDGRWRVRRESRRRCRPRPRRSAAGRSATRPARSRSGVTSAAWRPACRAPRAAPWQWPRPPPADPRATAASAHRMAAWPAFCHSTRRLGGQQCAGQRRIACRGCGIGNGRRPRTDIAPSGAQPTQQTGEPRLRMRVTQLLPREF